MSCILSSLLAVAVVVVVIIVILFMFAFVSNMETLNKYTQQIHMCMYVQLNVLPLSVYFHGRGMKTKIKKNIEYVLLCSLCR